YYADFGIAGCDVRIPVEINYKVPAPSAPGEMEFCSLSALAKIGITDPKKLEDLDICGNNLQWYDSSKNPINNPGSKKLSDGDIYYVTDEVNGCESAPLKIETTETDCGCLENDIKFYDLNWRQNYDECNMGNIGNTLSITPGPDNSVDHEAVMVTPGKDPWLDGIGYDLQRTSPFKEDCSSDDESFRIGTPAETVVSDRANSGNNPASVSAEKEFVAGEVLKFDFAMVLDEP